MRIMRKLYENRGRKIEIFKGNAGQRRYGLPDHEATCEGVTQGPVDEKQHGQSLVGRC